VVPPLDSIPVQESSLSSWVGVAEFNCTAAVASAVTAGSAARFFPGASLGPQERDWHGLQVAHGQRKRATCIPGLGWKGLIDSR
jgi:hypothetical protein